MYSKEVRKNRRTRKRHQHDNASCILLNPLTTDQRQEEKQDVATSILVVVVAGSSCG